MNHIIFKLSSSAPQVPHKIFILKLGPLFRKERSEIKPGNLRIRILCEPKSINGFGKQAGILDSDKKSMSTCSTLDSSLCFSLPQ